MVQHILVQHMLHQIKAPQFYTDLGLENKYKIMVYMLHQIKAQQFYTDSGLQRLLNPLVNGKIQGLFKAFECFPSTF